MRINKLLTVLALTLTPTLAMADTPDTADTVAINRAKEEIARAKAHRSIARLELRAKKAHDSADNAAKRAKAVDDKLSAAKSKAGKK